jgi:hypothetical protein
MYKKIKELCCLFNSIQFKRVVPLHICVFLITGNQRLRAIFTTLCIQILLYKARGREEGRERVKEIRSVDYYTLG